MSITPVFLGEKPNGVSPSRVSQFKKCPRQYQYVSVEKLPEKKSIDAYRGTIFHAVLENLFKDQPTPQDRTIENAMAEFRKVYPEYMTPEIAGEMGLDSEAQQKMAADITSHIRTYYTMEDPTKINLVSTEMRVDYDMGGFGLRGIIDRLDRKEDGTLEIVDYKTGKTPKPRYQAEALQACKIYAYLCQEVHGERPTSLRLIYVKNGDTIAKAVTDRDIRDAEINVRKTWGSIEACYEAGVFPPKPSVLCGWCSFQDVCEKDNNSPF